MCLAGHSPWWWRWRRGNTCTVVDLLRLPTLVMASIMPSSAPVAVAGGMRRNAVYECVAEIRSCTTAPDVKPVAYLPSVQHMPAEAYAVRSDPEKRGSRGGGGLSLQYDSIMMWGGVPYTKEACV